MGMVKRATFDISDTEQISEEFANKLLDSMFKSLDVKCECIIKLWKQKGYIKQSREDEIRERLVILYNTEEIFTGYNKNIEEYASLQKELIEIYEKKLNVNKT